MTEPNITCPLCRFRHPVSRSCDEAARLADQARAKREEVLRQLGLRREHPSEVPLAWTPYKPGDHVPTTQYYWIRARTYMVNPRLAFRDDGFCDLDGDPIDACVDYYIPIATPELPR